MSDIIYSQVIWALDDNDFRQHLLKEVKLSDITQKRSVLTRFERREAGVDLPRFIGNNLSHFLADLVKHIDLKFPHLFTMRNGIEKYLEPEQGEPAVGEVKLDDSGPWDANPRFFEGMAVESLVDLFNKHERAIWERIRVAGRMDTTMGQIATELGMDWPRKSANLTVGSFERKRKSVVLTKGYGKKLKLPMLLSCILWAAFDGKIRERPQGAISPSNVLEAVDLTEAEERVIHIRFMDGEPRTLDEAGKILDVTRERVRQIQGYALDRIRRNKFTEPVREWLYGQCENIFEVLSEDGGLTVKRSAANGAKAKREIEGLALGLEITDVSFPELLGKVAIQVDGGYWLRKL